MDLSHSGPSPAACVDLVITHLDNRHAFGEGCLQIGGGDVGDLGVVALRAYYSCRRQEKRDQSHPRRFHCQSPHLLAVVLSLNAPAPANAIAASRAALEAPLTPMAPTT